jgi:acyl-CoA oxidase
MAARIKAVAQHVATTSPGAAAAVAAPTVPAPTATVSLDELAMHNRPDDSWLAYDGTVYDVTPLLRQMPSAAATLMGLAGTDASDALDPDTVDTAPRGPAYAAEMAVLRAGLTGHGTCAAVGQLLPATGADMAWQGDPRAPRRPLPDDAFVADVHNLEPGPSASWNSGGTAHVLPAERAQASFAVDALTHILDGGEEETRRRRFIIRAGRELAPQLQGAAKYDVPREGANGAIASAFTHFMRIHGPWLDQMYVPTGNETMYMSMGSMMGGYPGFGLFLLTMLGQTSDEQKSWWMEHAYSMGITGSYAQTELGHGSNVRGLQTTATFDPEGGVDGEWVLDTPTLDSMKWWPSNMVMSTHCVLYAQVIIHGEEKGVHVFFVQLRDEDLRPLPGVEVGDIGTKAGDNFVDIGYLRLKGVRIPRRHLMEKRQHVEPDGTYVKHGAKLSPKAQAAAEKAHYLTMMSARIALVGGSGASLAKAATIAVRYSLVRRQGFASAATGTSFRAPELQIIDYRSNQYCLLKWLANACAQRFASNWTTGKLDTMMAGDAGAMELLPELHATSAGLKGYCCNATAVGIEELRKCCGGAGYLLASGIAPLEADFKWRATAEGDTNVMLLQTARYLLSAAADASAGRPLAGLTAIFAPMAQPGFSPSALCPPPAADVQAMCDLAHLERLFAYRTITQVSSLQAN